MAHKPPKATGPASGRDLNPSQETLKPLSLSVTFASKICLTSCFQTAFEHLQGRRAHYHPRPSPHNECSPLTHKALLW